MEISMKHEDENIIKLLGYILLIGFNLNPYLNNIDYEMTSTKLLRAYLRKYDFNKRLKLIHDFITVSWLRKHLRRSLQLKIFNDSYMNSNLLFFLHHFIYNYDVAYDDWKNSLMKVAKNEDKLYDFFSKLNSIKFIMIVPFNINVHTSPSSTP